MVVERETARQRACKDFKVWLRNHIAVQPLSFVLPGGGTMLATYLIPPDTSITLAAIYGFIGGAVGLALLYSGVYLIQLLRAPYKQLKELGIEYSKLQSEQENSKQINGIKLDVSGLIFEGTEILRGFRSIKTFGDAWPIEEFKAWREKAMELFYRHKLGDYSSLWFKDTSCVDISQPVLKDFIKACESGLQRLEELLKGLH